MSRPQSLRRWIVCALAFACGIAHAAPPLLNLPIRCQMGVDCYIQNYFDHDAEPTWRDYACGRLSYNGHTGTDFRIADLVAMRAGVPVIAAADGVVASTRDGEPDISVKERGKEALNGRDAGNGVRIKHGEGWETQYSHLRKGSVVVRPGQVVKTGQVLGLVGLSGNTEFPHVDFTVRKEGRPLDPFAPEATTCGDSTGNLWDSAVSSQLNYQASGLLIAGFSPTPLSRDQAQAGDYDPKSITQGSPAIVFWAEIFGLREGDTLELRITSPSGQAITTSTLPITHHSAIGFFSTRKQRSQERWPPGQYRGEITLRRLENTVIRATRFLEVR